MKQLRASFAVGGALLLAVLCGALSSPCALAQGAGPSAPPPGKALIYVVRSDPEPREALVPVVVNTEVLGYLENGSFTTAVVNPGKVFVRTGDQVVSSFTLEAAPDRSYYLRVQAIHGTSVVQTEIVPMNDAQGRDAVAQGRFAPPAPPQERRRSEAEFARGQAVIGEPVYYRLEAGYSVSTGADLKDKDFANSGIICGDPACNTAGKLKDVGNGFVLNAGVGYRFGTNTRGDLMFGYRRFSLDQTDASTPATRFKADITALTAMANGYLDFSSTGFSPYIGVGVGVSQNKVGTVTFDDGAGFAGSVPGGTKTDFAAAFMAGVGIPMQGWVLDIGYRYISMGKLDVPADSSTGYDGATGKLMAHELTLAMRFY